MAAWLAALVGGVRPGRRVRRGAQAGLPAAGVGVEGRRRHARGAIPAEGRRHHPDRRPLRGRRHLTRGAGEGRGDLRRRRRRATTSWPSPARSPTAAPRRSPSDGTTAYAEVALDQRDSDFTPEEAKALVEPILAAADDTLQVEVGGPVAALSQTAPFGTEGIGLIAAAIILLFVFGSAVAMGLPLITAVFGLGTAIALGEVLRRVVDVPDWAPPTAAMVGLGVGIDYALLIVTRFRSNLAEGQEPRPATVGAIATAGRAVVFAGLVVIVSMLGILLVGLASLNGFAFTVSLAVLLVMAASLTLLPALLGFTGRNIERLHVPFVGKNPHAYDTSRWYRWSRFVQRRPWVAAIGGLAVLLALAAPFLGLRLGFPDAQNDPPSYTTKKAYDLLADGFGPGFSAPIVLTVQGASDGDLLDRHGRARRAAGGGATAWHASRRPWSTRPATPPCSP